MIDFNKLAFLLCFCCYGVSFSQQNFDIVSQDAKRKDYIELYNHVPPGIAEDKLFASLSYKLPFTPNSVWKLSSICENRQRFNFNTDEVAIVKSMINQLATAYFMERKYVLFQVVGGAGGCPEQLLLHERISGFDVTIFRICLSSINHSTDVDFYAVFNERMQSLMKI